MADWTNSAKAELDKYSARVSERLAGSGADTTEVIDDLKRHIEAEIQAARLQIVTEEDLRRILARIGEPAASLAEGHSTRSEPVEAQPEFLSAAAKPERKPLRLFVLIFGVILPIVTIVTELVTRMCSEVLFDPLPTVWHVLMVAAVPLSNLAIWFAVREDKVSWRHKLGIANGFAIGVASYYTLMFLPLMPFATFGVIYFGFGLLPLTPFLSWMVALWQRRKLRFIGAKEEFPKLSGTWWGLSGALVVLAFVALPIPLTRFFEDMATSDTPAESARGIKWLRSIGVNNVLLHDCYWNSGWEFDSPFAFLVEGRPVDTEHARTIYFRVTGESFNNQPPPHAGRYSRGASLYEDWEWDNAVAGETVAGRIKGLTLHSSRVDSKVEPDAALAYSEWTMEFKNDSHVQREARAQILLPPGAVVSRLTLWVNGEEREAAFGGRSQVRRAYQEVVEHRRDPVLVTTCGPDRILMQCFPVSPDGGLMKIRIGITAPLALENFASGNLRQPVFLERNFSLPENVKHSVWVESKEPLKSSLGKLTEDHAQPGHFVLRGELTDAELNDPAVSTIVHRNGDIREVWAQYGGKNQMVRQKIVEKKEPALSRIIVVVDGSAGMGESVPAIASALRQMPEGVDFTTMLASDADTLSEILRKGSQPAHETAAGECAKIQTIGGQDNVPALMRAWDLAAQTTNGVVVWIHGPQPVLLTDVEGLRQRFERRPQSPRLFEIQTKSGPNRVSEDLDGLGAVV
jgi:hypothetical protein